MTESAANSSTAPVDPQAVILQLQGLLNEEQRKTKSLTARLAVAEKRLGAELVASKYAAAEIKGLNRQLSEGQQKVGTL
jgi:hypothetical protein